jgi:hypothetical protein
MERRSSEKKTSAIVSRNGKKAVSGCILKSKYQRRSDGQKDLHGLSGKKAKE